MGLRLFKNHHTIDLVLRLFPFGSPPFGRLVGEFRRRVMEEVAASGLPGLTFTYVWAFDDPRDERAVAEFASIFTARRGRAVHVELQAPHEERLRRCETELRLAQKPFMRDVAVSRAHLVDGDAGYQLDPGGRFDGRADWLRIDNVALPPAAAAERIIATSRSRGPTARLRPRRADRPASSHRTESNLHG